MNLQRLFWIVLLALISVVAPVYAQHGAEHSSAPAAGADKESLDAILLMDASGSMRLTDPARLRDEGARLFIQLLKDGDRLGIVEFSEKAKVIRPLSNYRSDQAGQIAQAVAKVGNSGLYTDIHAAIEAASKMIQENPREGARQVVILLSDGKLDPDPKVATASRLESELVDTTLPALKGKGVKVYTLAFSAEADQDFLSSVADETEGVHWYTPSADDIHESFADLFLAVKKPQILPLTSKGFRIDPDVQEATFYINRQDGAEISVMSPGGKQFTPEDDGKGVKWFRGQKFDVITIEQPEVGNWQIVGLPSNDGFATVLTNLKLITDWPTSISSGNKYLLQARLYENDKPVQLTEMTSVTRFAYQVTPTDRVSEPIIREFLVDDGTNGDRIANDGIFSAAITLETPGAYKVRVVARAPTYERHQQIPFRVKPRLLSLSVIHVEDSGGFGNAGHGAGHSQEHGKGDGDDAESATIDLFRLTLSDDAMELRNPQLELLAVDSSRKRYQLPLKKIKSDGSVYESVSTYLPGDGQFKIKGTIVGKSKRKGRVSSESNVVDYQKKASVSEGEVHVVHVTEKPKEPEKPASPFIWIVLLTVANAGLGGFFILQARKNAGTEEITVEEFVASPEILEAIGKLEERSAMAEIDPDDPLLSDEHLANIVLPSASVGADAAAQPDSTQEPQAETETAAEEQAEVPAEEQEAESASEGAGEAPEEQEPEAAADDGGEEPQAESEQGESAGEDQSEEEKPEGEG